jgi:DNA polymerase alpha subunit A
LIALQGRKKATSKAAKSKAKPLPPEPAPMSAYRAVKSEVKDGEFLDSLLGEMSAAPVTKQISRKRKSSPVLRHSSFSSFRDHQGASSDGPDDFPEPTSFGKRREALSSDDEAFPTPTKRFKAENGASVKVMQTAAKVGKLQMNDAYDEFEDEYAPIELDMEIDAPIKKEESPVALSKLRSPTNGFKSEPAAAKKEEDSAPPSWLSVHATLPVMSNDKVGDGSNNLVSTRVQALEEDGSLRMFWLDYLELDGKVYLVGKILDKAIDQYVSACVTIENLDRNLFVLPRPRRVEDDYETDIEPSQRDVQQDFEEARRSFNIKRCGIKWVKRKYAFEEPDVPKEETMWMKVVYPFSGMDCPKLVLFV